MLNRIATAAIAIPPSTQAAIAVMTLAGAITAGTKAAKKAAGLMEECFGRAAKLRKADKKKVEVAAEYGWFIGFLSVVAIIFLFLLVFLITR